MGVNSVKKFRGGVLIAAAFVVLPSLFALAAQGRPADADSGWQSEWAAQPGFSLRVDTDGYQFPTAIAFVPSAGKNPHDPLYFVAELRGKVKVVTNDRTVHTFAEN